VRRTFTWKSTDAGDGFVPDFMTGDNLNPAFGGSGVAHDVVEHAVDTQGGYAGECMAFGAIVAGRFAAGMINGGWSGKSPEQSLGSELGALMADHLWEDNYLPDPGRTCACDADETFSYMLDAFGGSFINEARGRGDFFGVGGEPAFTGEDRRRVLGWLRRGYRAARRLYGANAADFYQDVSRAVGTKANHAEYGDRLTVRIDLKTGVVRASVEEAWKVE